MQQPKVVAPQQLKPEPVGAVVRAVLILKGFQIGIDLPRRECPRGQPGRELAGVIQPREPVARVLVAVGQLAGKVLGQVGQRGSLAAITRGRSVGEGRAGVAALGRCGLLDAGSALLCPHGLQHGCGHIGRGQQLGGRGQWRSGGDACALHLLAEAGEHAGQLAQRCA